MAFESSIWQGVVHSTQEVRAWANQGLEKVTGKIEDFTTEARRRAKLALLTFAGACVLLTGCAGGIEATSTPAPNLATREAEATNAVNDYATELAQKAEDKQTLCSTIEEIAGEAADAGVRNMTCGDVSNELGPNGCAMAAAYSASNEFYNHDRDRDGEVCENVCDSPYVYMFDDGTIVELDPDEMQQAMSYCQN